MGSTKVLANSGMTVVSTKDAMKDRPEFSDTAIKERIVKPTFHIERGTKIAAIKAELIPEAYIDCDFNLDKIVENQKAQYRASPRKFVVKRFDDYKEVTTGILSTIISRMVPNQSYIIGAPNGFGKTSFVNTCIMRLYQQNKDCAPYISLSDLAQIKITNEKRLLSGISPNDAYKYNSIDAEYGEEYLKEFYNNMDSETYIKKPINLINKFSWSEYMNCAILFCYFTDVSSKVLESEMLKTIITVRGTKGLPTVAMISTSLNPYKNDMYLAEYVWNEILAYDTAAPSYDRVKHVSCYKDYNAPLRTSNKEG